MKRLVLFLLCAAVPALSSTAQAITWHVPTDAPTIQAGIDSASAGDTVLVACGMYYEHDIVMKSGITLRSESGEPDGASINGERRSRVLYCENLDSTTCIEGFRIAQGFVFSGSEVFGGAGILCLNSSPRIVNCNIFRCHCGGRGSGVACMDGSSPNLVNCFFFLNEGGTYGAGLFCGNHSSPSLTDCRFHLNSGTYGGAVYCIHSSCPSLTRCTMYRNDSVYGGGVYSSANACPALCSCTLSENFGAFGGGGIWCGPYSSVEADRTVVAFSSRGEAIYCHPGNVTLTCCDLYGNAGGDWVGGVADQYGVSGNFSEDPLFCEPSTGDYHIDCNSPCAHGYGCGLVGAYGIGCGATRIKSETWSSLKALYRPWYRKR
ncbi:MAG: hypothetical protein KAW17_03735 [Candidatus Eisenbacteria sp.]|nr:hypothetical protein [Candidatus Eisenbacteria bacterium]